MTPTLALYCRIGKRLERRANFFPQRFLVEGQRRLKSWCCHGVPARAYRHLSISDGDDAFQSTLLNIGIPCLA